MFKGVVSNLFFLFVFLSVSFSTSLLMSTPPIALPPAMPSLAQASSSSLSALKSAARRSIRSCLKSLPSLRPESEEACRHLFASELYKSSRSIGVFLSMPSGEFETWPILANALSAGKAVYVPVLVPGSSRPGGPPLASFGAPPAGAERMEMQRVPPGTTVEDVRERWGRNRWSIPEPPASDGRDFAYLSSPGCSGASPPLNPLDLLLVPGLLFGHPSGKRLGQGLGFYDRYLSGVVDAFPAERGGLVVVGICVECQLVSDGVPPPPACEGSQGGHEPLPRDPCAAVPVDDWDERVDAICCPRGLLSCDKTPARK